MIAVNNSGSHQPVGVVVISSGLVAVVVVYIRQIVVVVAVVVVVGGGVVVRAIADGGAATSYINATFYSHSSVYTLMSSDVNLHERSCANSDDIMMHLFNPVPNIRTYRKTLLRSILIFFYILGVNSKPPF